MIFFIDLIITEYLGFYNIRYNKGIILIYGKTNSKKIKDKLPDDF